MCIPVALIDLGFVGFNLLLLCWALWAFRERGPSMTDIDLMFKYNVEYPELKRMKKAGIV
jgi:hypothetical protein